MGNLSKTEMGAWRNYHKRGCTARKRCKVNQISLDLSNSREHNLKMLEICKRLYEKGHNFLTEAVPNSEDRRIDIVDLSENVSGMRIEVEVSEEEKEDADVTMMKAEEGWEVKCSTDEAKEYWKNIK